MDKSNFENLVHIAPVSKAESVKLHLVAITASGMILKLLQIAILHMPDIAKVTPKLDELGYKASTKYLLETSSNSSP